MLRTLRVIRFPEQMQVAGPVIKANLITCVRNHEEVIAHAQSQAQSILSTAHEEAAAIKEQVKKDVAYRLQEDLASIRHLTRSNDKAVRETASQLCVDICNAVVRQVLKAAPPDQKIALLVDSLLSRSQSARELKLRTNPSNLEIVDQHLAKIMASQMNLKKWSVQPDAEVPEFELRIATDNGAEIRVSLENLIALYEEEIRMISHDIKPIMNSLEVSDADHA